MDNYFIALILITILTFIISIVLSIFFVYIPFQRISTKFDDEVRQGIQIIDSSLIVVDDVINTGNIISTFLVTTCQGINDKQGIIFNPMGKSGAFVKPCEFIQSCGKSNICYI